MTGALSDDDIAQRIRDGRRCQLCREDHLPGGRLCGEHCDELGRMLDPDYLGERLLERAGSIPQLWALLDPTPGRSGGLEVRPPGFGSAPPCNLDRVVMRDPRSKAYPVVDVWFELLPGTNLPDWDAPHFEDDSAARAVEKAVAGLVDVVWDELDYHGPRAPRTVAQHCGWLHAHLDHLTSRDDADEVYRDVQDLHDQLRPAAGWPKPRPVAECTGWVRDRDTGERVECGAPLYLPPPDPGVHSGPAQPAKVDPRRPVTRCRRCDRPYTALMLLRQEISQERAAS